MSQFVIKKLPLRLPDDLTGGDESLRGLYFRSLIGPANVGGGEIWGAVEVATGKVVSLAVCVPPGKALNET
ncbi:hypothetical protein Clacol_001881 [Clathrus columnatus]|nr:hypothetical protein Clacol_001881 [Clathrus columnatus]